MKLSFMFTQDNTISDLKKKTQNLEKLKFLLEFLLSDLQKKVEPQQEDIKEKKERIDQVGPKMFLW